jgi:hypothetical protein
LLKQNISEDNTYNPLTGFSTKRNSYMHAFLKQPLAQLVKRLREGWEWMAVPSYLEIGTASLTACQ